MFSHWQFDVFTSLAVAAICPDELVIRHNGIISMGALSPKSGNARMRNDTVPIDNQVFDSEVPTGELRSASKLGFVLATDAMCLDVLLTLKLRGLLSEFQTDWALLFQRAAVSIRAYYRLLLRDPVKELNALTEAAEILNEPGVDAKIWDEGICSSLPKYTHTSILGRV